MIPKVIHCFWFSGERKSALVTRCQASWREFAPAFEIREWNVEMLRGRFADSEGKLPPFVESALASRKWAFASDWARFAVIAAEGGVYLDMDVELIKPIDDLIEAGPFFALSTDSPRWVDPGLGFAAEKGDEVCMTIARRYEAMEFDPACHLSETCPAIANEIIAAFPSRTLLPAAVFNPKGTCAGKIRLTEDTRAIHHFAASWFNWKQRLAYVVLPRHRGILTALRFFGIIRGN